MAIRLMFGLGLVMLIALGSTAQDQQADDKKAKEHALVALLNEKLTQAKAAHDAGDLNQAIAILDEAGRIDATRDLIWFKLGEYYRESKRYPEAIAAYNRAIAIKPVGAYYNNLGESWAKQGNLHDAEQAYRTAAQVDPTNGAQYYFNIGAIETNAVNLEAANAAFEEAIHANPSFAGAYYQKGLNLLNEAETIRGKAVYPPEVSTDLQKYLELAPSGPYATVCHEVLEFLERDIRATYIRGITPEKPSAGPQESEAKPIAADTMESYMVRKVSPVYPAIARTARVEGTVVLDSLISTDGSVEHLVVLSGNPLLVEPAIEAAQQWRYQPYVVNSEPVFAQTEILVNFQLASGGQIGPRYFGLLDVLQLLQNGVAPARVAVLIRRAKVSFDMTEMKERQIRDAGGDDAVVQAARENHQ